VLLLGDSHSASLSLGLRPLLEKLQVNLMQVSTGWCQPTSDDNKNKTCIEINKKVNDVIRTTPIDLLIINSHWVWLRGRLTGIKLKTIVCTL